MARNVSRSISDLRIATVHIFNHVLGLDHVSRSKHFIMVQSLIVVFFGVMFLNYFLLLLAYNMAGLLSVGWRVLIEINDNYLD